jgi:hypothetical protein
LDSLLIGGSGQLHLATIDKRERSHDPRVLAERDPARVERLRTKLLVGAKQMRGDGDVVERSLRETLGGEPTTAVKTAA